MARVTSDAGRVPGPEVLFLTPSEVSAVLDVSERTLQIWDEGRDGIVGPPRSPVTSSTVRYEREGLLAWIDEHYSGDPGVDRSGDLLIRRQAVAGIIRVELKTIERWAAGKVAGLEAPPAVRISKVVVRYWEFDILAWMRSTHVRRSVESPGDYRRRRAAG